VKRLGGVASETFSSIKVVIAFGGEEIERRKMEKCIQETERIGKRQQIIFGTMMSLTKMAVFMYYTYTFFLGGIFMMNGNINSKTDVEYSSEDIISILIAFITGFISLVAALPNV